ncbi:hypothetical protein RYA05_02720 [Pseudomonas syringae pv. actinidiae]|nr:hypothetical protein [Pseudomonas syringae pv. actinidiae]
MANVDNLIAGLKILQAYKPDMEANSTHRTRRVMEAQEVEFANITPDDKARLLALGWWTNDHYLWGY